LLFTASGQRIVFQRQLLLRRLSKTRKPSLEISSENQKISDRGKPIEALILFMELKMCKGRILGTRHDAFTENLLQEKWSPTKTLESASSRIAETW